MSVAHNVRYIVTHIAYVRCSFDMRSMKRKTVGENLNQPNNNNDVAMLSTNIIILYKFAILLFINEFVHKIKFRTSFNVHSTQQLMERPQIEKIE